MLDNLAGKVVAMIVVVGIHGEVLRLFLAKQSEIGWVHAHLFGMAVTTNMVVEADYLVGLCHY